MTDTLEARLNAKTDWQLLRLYAEGSEAAFAALARRYMDLVYSVCRREVGENALAEDAAQAVFLILARRADSLRPRRDEAALAGWLFEAARLASRNALRGERRRQAVERAYAQEAARMSEYSSADAPPWAEAEPLLTEALHALPAGQRALILERFVQDRSLAEIGAERGVSENAARMRVNRALERLRRFFAARGVAFSTAALAACLAQSVRPAPARCAEAVQVPCTAHTPADTIAQGATHTMNLNRLRLKLGAAASVACLSLGTAGAVRVSTEMKAKAVRAERAQDQARALAVLDQMYATYAAMKSFSCNVTSREEPLHTAQDAEYLLQRPGKIRFHRATLLGADMSGQALAVSDGNTFFVTCTENHGRADRYANLPLSPLNSFRLADFGDLPAWGTQPYAGMPYVALALKPPKDLGLSEPEYTLEAPATIDFPGVPGPVLLDVVVARMHRLPPVDAMTDDTELVTYYISRQDHLLYKLTAADKISPTEWDTRTELINGMEINKATDPDDFRFTPPPGSHAVPRTSDLFPQDNLMRHDFRHDLRRKP